MKRDTTTGGIPDELALWMVSAGLVLAKIAGWASILVCLLLAAGWETSRFRVSVEVDLIAHRVPTVTDNSARFLDLVAELRPRPDAAELRRRSP